MSPPEIWGPPIWTLFHTLAEKINPISYPKVVNSLFGVIVRICKFLPCPECSKDASNFLAKIKISEYKTKDEFKNMLYLFHNYVNAKKRKPLFNYGYINKYSNLNLNIIIKNFIEHYNTKGNMNLLSDSFQRTLVVKDFINWFRYYSRAFTNSIMYQQPHSNIIKESSDSIIEEDKQKETSNIIIEDNSNAD